MLQSRVISLFRNFSKEEMKRFDAFLMSPYFNQSDKLIKFYRLIAPHHPLFDSKRLQKEKLYSTLYSKDEYNDQAMRKLISDLYKLAKIFIAQEGFEKDELQGGIYLHRWLTEHNIEKIVDAELETRRAILDGAMIHDDDYYYHSWMYELHKFKAESDRLRGAEHKLLKGFDLWAPIHAHNRNYLINCFWLHLFLLTIERLYNFPMDESLLNQVESLAPRYINQGDTIIDFFYNIFKLIRTEEAPYYFELKERFLIKDPLIPQTLLREACVSMENFCISRIREGEEQFVSEVMQIYRLEVENELYLENGAIDTIYYFNVALRGTECGELDWADEFIENNKKYLPDDRREDSYSYAKAHILLGQHRYEEALRMALSCQIPHLVGRITIRVLVARIQYELGMMDEILVELNAWKHQLKDEKLSKEFKSYFHQFFVSIKQLCELREDYTRDKYVQLHDQIKMSKAMPGKKWFLEKLREMEQERS